jgi:hypothetical protein
VTSKYKISKRQANTENHNYSQEKIIFLTIALIVGFCICKLIWGKGNIHPSAHSSYPIPCKDVGREKMINTCNSHSPEVKDH